MEHNESIAIKMKQNLLEIRKVLKMIDICKTEPGVKVKQSVDSKKHEVLEIDYQQDVEIECESDDESRKSSD